MIEKRDLLLHPIRLRIVQALVGDAMTPLQLKDRLGDVPQATLYRHINQLADGGLLEVVSERPIRGGTERTYRVVTSAVALEESDLESATTDEHFRYFATFVGTLLTDFASYLESSKKSGKESSETSGTESGKKSGETSGRPALGEDRVGYRQQALWLSDEEFDALIETMAAAVNERVDNRPAPGRRRRLLSTVVMPDDRT
jgi:DNA-binding transcriptional ArsR family regulator